MKFKPCPYCGSHAHIVGERIYEEVWCGDSNCLAHARPHVWNNRVIPEGLLEHIQQSSGLDADSKQRVRMVIEEFFEQ